MSIRNPIGALKAVQLVEPVDASNTAAATSAYVAIPKGATSLMIVAQAGILDDGTLDWSFKTAENGGGTGEADLVPNETPVQVTTSNDHPNTQTFTFDPLKLKGYVKVIGTIVTGGALVAATAVYSEK